MKKFRHYLCNKFIIVTDHQPLKWLNDIKNPQGKIARYKMMLQGYDYEIVHTAGKNNILPDYLSRLYAIKDIEEEQLIKRVHLLTGHSERCCIFLYKEQL